MVLAPLDCPPIDGLPASYDVAPARVPPILDLGEVMRGDSFHITARCFWEDGLTIMDLTAATVWATFKVDPLDDDGAPPGFQVSTLSSGVVILDPPEAGVVKVSVWGVQTNNLEEAPIQMRCDIQVKTASGETRTVMRATLVLVDDITRAQG